ncbi:Spermatogenesis-associated serine-rich protein 1 [Camelus dromedarius]|uniref:Spermatogenesis-associated serine-rich protein 1 n=1 Tax=Camelus dromedarius TaxID=9838 RepID=A0A5N4CRK2_CAMDR|nr:Spermatogenesis-associated serine-rich protein 1 [Camelus dromedarius]
MRREEAQEAPPGGKQRPRVAGQVSRQPRNAPPWEAQAAAAAASLLPSALRFLAWHSAVQLLFGAGVHGHWKRSTVLSSSPYQHSDLQYRAGEGSRERLWHDHGGEEIQLSTKQNDFLESKGCSANPTSSGRNVSPSSSVETGPSVSVPLSPRGASVYLPISDVLQKMDNVLSGHFTRGLAATSTPTMLESSASLMESSLATGGLCQRGQWKSALEGRNTEGSDGVPYEKKFDTFIPLEPLPQVPNLPFWVKEKANKLKNEIQEVKELDNWQPAVPLLQSLLPAGGLENLQRIVLWTFRNNPEKKQVQKVCTDCPLRASNH